MDDITIDSLVERAERLSEEGPFLARIRAIDLVLLDIEVTQRLFPQAEGNRAVETCIGVLRGMRRINELHLARVRANRKETG